MSCFDTAKSVLRKLDGEFNDLATASIKAAAEGGSIPTALYNTAGTKDGNTKDKDVPVQRLHSMRNFCIEAIANALHHTGHHGDAPKLLRLNVLEQRPDTIMVQVDKDTVDDAVDKQQSLTLPTREMLKALERLERQMFGGWQQTLIPQGEQKVAFAVKRFKNENEVKSIISLFAAMAGSQGTLPEFFHLQNQDGKSDPLTLMMRKEELAALAAKEGTMEYQIEGGKRSPEPLRTLQKMSVHMRVFDEAKAIADRPPSHKRFIKNVEFLDRVIGLIKEKKDWETAEAFLHSHWKEFETIRPRLLYIAAVQRLADDYRMATLDKFNYERLTQKPSEIKRVVNDIAQEINSDWKKAPNRVTRLILGENEEKETLEHALYAFALSVMTSYDDWKPLVQDISFDPSGKRVTIHPRLMECIEQEQEMAASAAAGR